MGVCVEADVGGVAGLVGGPVILWVVFTRNVADLKGCALPGDLTLPVGISRLPLERLRGGSRGVLPTVGGEG